MNLADAYAVLEVSPDAQPVDIRSAYRRLALAHHPDRNGNSRESIARFNRITRAYQLLHARGGSRVEPDTCPRCGMPFAGRADRGGAARDDPCGPCRQQISRRLMLPAVPAIVVRCTGAGVLLAVAGSLLAVFLKDGALAYGLAAIGTSVIAVVWLAVIAVRVGDAAPRTTRRRR